MATHMHRIKHSQVSQRRFIGKDPLRQVCQPVLSQLPVATHRTQKKKRRHLAHSLKDMTNVDTHRSLRRVSP